MSFDIPPIERWTAEGCKKAPKLNAHRQIQVESHVVGTKIERDAVPPKTKRLGDERAP